MPTERRARKRAQENNKRANRTPEEREKYNAYYRKRFANMTPEQRARANKLRQEREARQGEAFLIEKRRKGRIRWAVIKERQRERRLFKAYSLTIEEKDRILKKQGGACAICTRPLAEKDGHVDHDHKTNKVRGVLCLNCNAGIGQLNDDPDLLFKAIVYLKENS